MDGTELLQGALVCREGMGRGRAGVGQGEVSLHPAAAAGAHGAVVAGYGRAARRIGLQRRLQTVLLVHLLVHELMSLQRRNRMIDEGGKRGGE